MRTAAPTGILATAKEERPPPAVMHPPAAIWLRGGVLGELRRRPLLPVVVRRSAVVLRECKTMKTALWRALIPPQPLRLPLRTKPGYLQARLGKR